jgi:hypothetical protein
MRKYLTSALFFFVVLAVIGLGVWAGESAEKSAPDVQIQIQGGEKGSQGSQGSPGEEGAPGAPGAPGPQGAPGAPAPAPQAAPVSPSSSGGTTFLGMDSTVAMVLGGVLVLVVIVSIVAISRSGSK